MLRLANAPSRDASLRHSCPRHAQSRVLAFCIVCTLLVEGACSRGSRPSETQGSGGSHQAQTHPSLVTRTPNCPPGGSAMLQPSAPDTGHHRVVLTWDASKSSPIAEDDAIGYCIYRSKKKGVARKNPNCNDCEQVNVIPVKATRCIDDLVQDRVTYYYVVAAINRQGVVSSSSNEILVSIPPGQRHASTSESSYPFCRGDSGSKIQPR
jgi:hypothetical protein